MSRSRPSARHRGDHEAAGAVGLQLDLAAFGDPAARTVDVGQLHFGARHQPGQTAHHEAHAANSEQADLLAELALHRLDVVLADRAPAPNPNLKLYSHALGSSPLAWYAPPALAAAARRGFPRSLAKVPVLLPTTHAVVRAALDQWFERAAVRPLVVGEIEDSALLKTFGANGMGLFAAAEWVHDELVARYGVTRIGRCEGVEEHFFAIGTEKKVMHPLLQRLLPARR